MNYLNDNTWIIKYVDTDLLRQLLDNDYYGMGSGMLNEEIIKVLDDKNLLYGNDDGLSPKTQSYEPSIKEKSKDKIVEGSKVEFTRKNDKIIGEVIEFTTKRDKCRICCRPGKTKTDSGAFYMVPVEELKLVKESDIEDVVEDVVEENRNDSPSEEIVVGTEVKWTKNGETLTGKVERITKTSYKICCKPGKVSGEKGSLYMIPIKDVQLKE